MAAVARKIVWNRKRNSRTMKKPFFALSDFGDAECGHGRRSPENSVEPKEEWS